MNYQGEVSQHVNWSAISRLVNPDPANPVENTGLRLPSCDFHTSRHSQVCGTSGWTKCPGLPDPCACVRGVTNKAAAMFYLPKPKWWIMGQWNPMYLQGRVNIKASIVSNSDSRASETLIITNAGWLRWANVCTTIRRWSHCRWLHLTFILDIIVDETICDRSDSLVEEGDLIVRKGRLNFAAVAEWAYNLHQY